MRATQSFLVAAMLRGAACGHNAAPKSRRSASAGPGAHGDANSASRKAGAWCAVQKTLQVITDRTLDVASSRFSSMAIGAASLKDSYIVDKACADGLLSMHEAAGLAYTTQVCSFRAAATLPVMPIK